MTVELKNTNYKEKVKPFARIYKNNKTTVLDPFIWLLKGLKDYFSIPLVSMFYGISFALFAFGLKEIVLYFDTHLVILPSLILLSLIGPFLALGLYQSSSEKMKKHNVSLLNSIFAIKRNPTSIWAFTIVLLVIMIFWLRVASLIHALYPMVEGSPLEAYTNFLITGSIVGSIFLLFTFSISAFSVPLLLERKTDVMTAIFTSFNAVKDNLIGMFVWGILIISLLGISFYINIALIAFTMPLIGYATWHSYKSTILKSYEE